MSAELKQLQPFSNQEDEQHFRQDVLAGLSAKKKHISSKYFYDKKGSELFNIITQHPDYYLTRCEFEIIERNKSKLANLLNTGAFNLIELGPGEGIKTKLLLDQFLQDNLDFTYYTIDISEKYLLQMVEKFNRELAQLKLIALNADYFKGLQWLAEESANPNLILFLGSSIGNFTPKQTNRFLSSMWHDLQDGDYCLIGFDLRKDLQVLFEAYNDRDGITREFNLNLLDRINCELGGHFNRKNFQHYAVYNVYSGAMESYLVSTQEQNVYVDALNKEFRFNAYEPLHLEYSYKYTLKQIEDFARLTGFKIVDNYFDSRGYFVDSLWQVVK